MKRGACSIVFFIVVLLVAASTNQQQVNISLSYFPANFTNIPAPQLPLNSTHYPWSWSGYALTCDGISNKTTGSTAIVNCTSLGLHGFSDILTFGNQNDPNTSVFDSNLSSATTNISQILMTIVINTTIVNSTATPINSPTYLEGIYWNNSVILFQFVPSTSPVKITNQSFAITQFAIVLPFNTSIITGQPGLQFFNPTLGRPSIFISCIEITYTWIYTTIPTTSPPPAPPTPSTPLPTLFPTPSQTPAPTLSPTSQPTPKPTANPTPQPIQMPTPTPTSQQTPNPTSEFIPSTAVPSTPPPSSSPTAEPTTNLPMTTEPAVAKSDTFTIIFISTSVILIIFLAICFVIVVLIVRRLRRTERTNRQLSWAQGTRAMQMKVNSRHKTMEQNELFDIPLDDHTPNNPVPAIPHFAKESHRYAYKEEVEEEYKQKQDEEDQTAKLSKKQPMLPTKPLPEIPKKRNPTLSVSPTAKPSPTVVSTDLPEIVEDFSEWDKEKKKHFKTDENLNKSQYALPILIPRHDNAAYANVPPLVDVKIPYQTFILQSPPTENNNASDISGKQEADTTTSSLTESKSESVAIDSSRTTSQNSTIYDSFSLTFPTAVTAVVARHTLSSNSTRMEQLEDEPPADEDSSIND